MHLGERGLSASGAGGLAVGVWALHRLGMSRERIARRTAAFFFLTSMANVAGVTAFAALYLLGVSGTTPTPRSPTRSVRRR